MVRRGADLTLVVDKCDIVWVTMSWGWAGWVAERAHGICAPFLFFFFPDFLRKVINCNCDIVSRDVIESRVEVVEGGFPRISVQGYIIVSKVHIYYLNER